MTLKERNIGLMIVGSPFSLIPDDDDEFYKLKSKNINSYLYGLDQSCTKEFRFSI